MLMENVLWLFAMNLHPTRFECQQAFDLVFVHAAVCFEIVFDMKAIAAAGEDNNEGRLGVGFFGLLVSTKFVRCGDAVNASLSSRLEKMSTEILHCRE